MFTWAHSLVQILWINVDMSAAATIGAPTDINLWF